MFKVQWAGLLSLHFLLEDGTSVPGGVDSEGCTFFGFHTILLVFGGVVVDFGVSCFCFHTFSFVVAWEQPLEFLPFSLGCSSLAPASFCFLYFSWWGGPLVEAVSQPPLCLADSAHIWYGLWSIAPVGAESRASLPCINLRVTFP